MKSKKEPCDYCDEEFKCLALNPSSRECIDHNSNYNNFRKKITKFDELEEKLYQARCETIKQCLKIMYTEDELRANLIHCVSELVAHEKITSDEMKIWNDKTNDWFNKNKK